MINLHPEVFVILKFITQHIPEDRWLINQEDILANYDSYRLRIYEKYNASNPEPTRNFIASQFRKVLLAANRNIPKVTLTYHIQGTMLIKQVTLLEPLTKWFDQNFATMGGSEMEQTVYFERFNTVNGVYDLDLFSKFLLGGIAMFGDFKDYIKKGHENYFKNQING